MKMNFFIMLICIILVGCKNEGKFYPGNIWLDNCGDTINAHGGGVLFHDGKYYWYGEYKGKKTTNALVGITCYSSKNLTDWDYEGVVLPVDTINKKSDIVKGCVMERPKVLYNKKTKKFVMWFHLELKGKGYSAARAAVAVSDTPNGPFKYLRSLRPNKEKLPFNWTDEDIKKYDALVLEEQVKKNKYNKDEVVNGIILKRDFSGGQMSRDMQLFLDDDGKAYHIYSSEENKTLHLAELSDDYLHHTGKYIRVAPNGINEAPALFKKGKTYWMITSGCTGWAPNKARMFSSNSIWGPWKQHENPCIGENAAITFGGQSTYVLKVEGLDDAFIFMADIWRPKKPIESRYLWLPIQFKDDIPYIEMKDRWSLDFFYHK